MQVKSLGYVVVSSTDLAKWDHYGTQVLGMMQSTSMNSADTLYLKMDQRAFRYAIVKGEFDGLLMAGWQLADEAAFNDALQELEQKNIAFEKITDADVLTSRSVNALARLSDPAGNQFELYWEDAKNADDGVAFKSPLDAVDGFVTRADDGHDMGLGHVVLHAPVKFEETHDFYASIGFLDSDITEMGPMGKIYFMNCNPRHHSLALWNWGAPSPETDFQPSPESTAPGCVHLMTEVSTLGEVGACLDRVNENEVMVTSTLGEHINDEMTSFYMLSPGNFQMEYGFDGNQLDASHKTTHNTLPSKWGHKWTG